MSPVSGVARVLTRRTRLAATVALTLAVAAILLIPEPPSFGGQWLSDLTSRWQYAPLDMLAVAAVIVALFAVVATLALRGAGLLKFLSVALLAATGYGILRAINDGVTNWECTVSPCPALVGSVGSAVGTWSAVALAGVAAFIAAAMLPGARSAR